MNMHIPSRQNIFREMRDYLMIALGMIMYGIGWTVFLLPNDITTGGVPGIASLVYLQQDCRYNMFISASTSYCYCLLSVFRMEVQHQDNFAVLPWLPFCQSFSNWQTAFTYWTTSLSWHVSSEHLSVAAASALLSLRTEVRAERILSQLSLTNTGTLHWDGSCCFVTLSSSLPATSCWKTGKSSIRLCHSIHL